MPSNRELTERRGPRVRSFFSSSPPSSVSRKSTSKAPSRPSKSTGMKSELKGIHSTTINGDDASTHVTFRKKTEDTVVGSITTELNSAPRNADCSELRSKERATGIAGPSRLRRSRSRFSGRHESTRPTAAGRFTTRVHGGEHTSIFVKAARAVSRIRVLSAQRLNRSFALFHSSYRARATYATLEASHLATLSGSLEGGRADSGDGPCDAKQPLAAGLWRGGSHRARPSSRPERPRLRRNPPWDLPR